MSHLLRARFPRLYAAASLKDSPLRGASCNSSRFPRLYAAASLKERRDVHGGGADVAFSAALCRGLIEGRCRSRRAATRCSRFPRLYAAASLKGRRVVGLVLVVDEFSAALCRGLIEGRASAPG